ncbi:MAG: acetyl-CoA acetyltransferase [Parvibaculaceae bacterium]
MVDPRTPILVGCGQVVQKEKDLNKVKDPATLMADAARLALADTTVASLEAKLDTITCTRFVIDSPGTRALPINQYANLPLTLANKIGAAPANTCYGPTGGNSPQLLVNYTAERIAEGDQDVVLLAGVECFGSFQKLLAAGMTPENWNDDPGGTRIDIGYEKEGVSEIENLHKLSHPVNCYPLFENGLRGEAGRTVKEQQLHIGKLMAPFTRVAAQHPQAWFPIERTPEEIATPSDANRYVGFPYTKYMNAIMAVDQAAAIVMMSVEKARELGVPEENWVYLHGCADANDLWYLTERQNFHSSPAIRTMGQKAFDMSGWSIGDIDLIDLYSCFPSAVQIGMKELGIADDDPRDLTVTGGLPYFGGAGNNYVMHSIATMVEKLRANPGKKGMCTANGYYVTKHGIGLYSTLPTEGPWKRENPANYQKDIDAMAHPRVEETPNGAAKIETYTVMHGRSGPEFGIVMGRLDADDARFVAHVTDQALIQSLMDKESLGRPGTVRSEEGALSIFTPD